MSRFEPRRRQQLSTDCLLIGAGDFWLVPAFSEVVVCYTEVMTASPSSLLHRVERTYFTAVRDLLVINSQPTPVVFDSH